MAKHSPHKKTKPQNILKQKVYVFLTRTIYFISLIIILSLTTSPAYSEEETSQKQQEIQIEESLKPTTTTEAAILRTPIPGPEEEIIIIQENLINIATDQIGTCGTEAIKKYAQGKASQWCSEFVSWIYKEAGIPFSGGVKDNPSSLINSQQIEKWFRSNNRYHSSKSDYFPKRGDYIQTRNTDGSLHSAIIINIAQDPNTNQIVFVTIDGNWNNCVKLIEEHKKSNILGFGEIANQ